MTLLYGCGIARRQRPGRQRHRGESEERHRPPSARRTSGRAELARAQPRA
jgi:hypothetical protein